jgi:hypothetical protein
MSCTTIESAKIEATKADIVRLANAIMSDTPFAVKDLNEQIIQITKEAGVEYIVICRKVKEHVNQCLPACTLPLTNSFAYLAL